MLYEHTRLENPVVPIEERWCAGLKELPVEGVHFSSIDPRIPRGEVPMGRAEVELLTANSG